MSGFFLYYKKVDWLNCSRQFLCMLVKVEFCCVRLEQIIEELEC